MGDAMDCNCDGCDCDCDCSGCDCTGCDCNCGDGCGGFCADKNVIICCCFPGSNNSSRTDRQNSGGEPSICCCCCCLPSNGRTSYPSRRPDSNENKLKKHKQKRGRGFCSCLWRCFSKKSSPPSMTPPQGTNEVPPRSYQQDGRYPMSQVPPGDYRRDSRYPMHNFPPRDNQSDLRYPMSEVPTRNYQRDGRYPSGMPPPEYYGYGRPHGPWKYADDLNASPRDRQQGQGRWTFSAEQDMPPRDFKLEGKWSRPAVH